MKMKECDKQNSHTSSKLHMINIYLPIIIDTLLTNNDRHPANIPEDLTY